MVTKTPFEAPIVDALSIRVVTDSYYDRFLPKPAHPAVVIENVSRIPGRHMETFAGEWGLALHLDSTMDGERSQFLLDFGQTPEVLNRNFDLLDIDPGQLNGLILSHGHLDHYGGLHGFIRQYRSRMRPDLSLFVGGETVFHEKWIKDKGKEPLHFGALDRTALKAHNVGPEICAAPRALGGAFTTGHIERQSFEEVTGGTMVEDFDHFSEAERRGKLVLDEHPDEHGTCYIVKGRGLVVISSCGHAGIVNTVKTAMAVSNVDKLHAVVGGFHLGLAKPDYLEHTVDELAALAPDAVVPMHCTGSNFIDLLRERMPDRLVTSNLGSRFTFRV